MIFQYKNFKKEILLNDREYSIYFLKHKLNEVLKIKSKNVSFKKQKPKAYEFKRFYNKIEQPPEFDDLCRLHYLMTTRKVITALEFGVGKSTLIINDALQKNMNNYQKKIAKIEFIRKYDQFKCFTVDNQLKWLNNIKKKHDTKRIIFHFSKLKMGTFNDKICTFFKHLPVVSPNLIYLDGPARFSPFGSIRGWTTNYVDGMPMLGDLLAIEHFLMPGTMLLVDGRTANARFILKNLQRDWIYFFDEKLDQHFFELSETPLGIYNKRYLEFSLGKNYFKRILHKKPYEF